MTAKDDISQLNQAQDLTPMEREFLELLQRLEPDQLKMEISYLRKIAGKKD